MREAVARRCLAAIDILQIRHVHPVRQSVEQRQRDVPALAGALAHEQRLHDRRQRRHAGGDVADRDADAGRAFRIAGHRGQAGFGLHQEVVGLQMREGAVVAIAGDRAGDQPGKALPQFGHVEAQSRDDAGREVLDEHVGLADQHRQALPVGRILQVQPDRFLATVQPDEIGALAMDETVVAAGEVALRAFDLQDPRPGIGQPPRHVGGGDRLFDGDDQDAGKIIVHGALRRFRAADRMRSDQDAGRLARPFPRR